jgi:anti-sigma B factor antagonist
MLHVDQQLTPAGYYLIRPEGELDAVNVFAFRVALTDMAGTGALLIDLSEVTFIDSAGLAAVVGAVRRAQYSGTRVSLACPRSGLQHVLRAAGMDTIVGVFDAVDQAAAALETDPQPTMRRPGHNGPSRPGWAQR